MNVFRPIGIAALAWRDAALGLGRWEVWRPVAAFVSFEFVVLAMLTGFTAPVLVELALPLVRLLGGERATHYPDHLYALPSMFERATLLARALVLPVVAAALCLRFAETYGAVARDATPRLRRGAILPLIAIGLIAYAIPTVLAALFDAVVPRVSPTLQEYASRFTVTSILLALVWLVHAVFSIALRGNGLRAGLHDGVRRMAIFAVPTLLVVAVPLALLHPLAVSLPAADLQAASLRPELTILLVSVRILVEALLLVFLVGAGTRLFVSRRGGQR